MKKIIYSSVLIILILIIVNTKKTGFRNVHIKDYNKSYDVYTNKVLVKDILSEFKILINKDDLIYPTLNSKIDTLTQNIQICRVNIVYKSKIEPIAQQEIVVPTKALPLGMRMTTVPGSKGYREETYKVIFLNGNITREDLIDARIICKPQKKIILKGISKKKYIVKNNKIKKGTLLKLHSTAYSPAAASCAPFDDGYTAIGLKACYGVVAVDPKIVPLGTMFYIKGYGYGVACDVGSAIKLNDMDLCFKNELVAAEYGVKETTGYVIR